MHVAHTSTYEVDATHRLVAELPPVARPLRLLIPCYEVNLSGGMLRIDRVAAALQGAGHSFAFMPLGGGAKSDRQTRIPKIGLEEASQSEWDATLVPGGGFPGDVIAALEALQSDQFGRRVQLVLNDPSRRDAFLRVNKAFRPEKVIFNNRAWPVGQFDDFVGDYFFHLEGAVDTRLFRPAIKGFRFSRHQRIGGLAYKNPLPLVDALAKLPGRIGLDLFGPDTHDLARQYESHIKSGRLVLHGEIEAGELPRFYRGIDLICMTELQGGWSNLVAEGMACGLPVICTPYGTAALAEDQRTALVIPDATNDAVARAVIRLIQAPSIAKRLARAGRGRAERYNWPGYAEALMKLIEYEGPRSGIYSPNEGAFGARKPTAVEAAD